MAAQDGDPLAPFNTGDKFEPTARTLNAWQQAAKAALGDGFAASGGGFIPTAEITIKNATANNRLRGEMLNPSTPLFLPTTHEHVVREVPRFSGSGSWADFDTPAVLLEPIPAGGLGKAALAGVVWAKVNIQTSGDRYCYAKAGTGTYNQYSHAGTGTGKIIWPLSGTGVKDALVLLGIEPPTFFAATIDTWNISTHTGTATVQGSTSTVAVERWTYMGDLEEDEPVFVFFSRSVAKFYVVGHPGLTMQDVLLKDIESTTDIVFHKLRIWTQIEGDSSVAHTITTTECP